MASINFSLDSSFPDWLICLHADSQIARIAVPEQQWSPTDGAEREFCRVGGQQKQERAAVDTANADQRVDTTDTARNRRVIGSSFLMILFYSPFVFVGVLAFDLDLDLDLADAGKLED